MIKKKRLKELILERKPCLQCEFNEGCGFLSVLFTGVSQVIEMIPGTSCIGQ